MLEGELARIYRQLWESTAAETPNVPAFYRQTATFLRIPGAAAHASAIFTTHLAHRTDRSEPQIWVRRDPQPAVAPDVEGATLAELIALAHERGHERSFREGTYKPMTMAEERRAWNHARSILRELGFAGDEDWDTFDRHREFSLNHHAKVGTPESE